MKTNRIASVFVGLTIKALEGERQAVREFVRGWRLADYSAETIPTGTNRRSALTEAITASDLFIGIYASPMPMEPPLLWYEELNIALNSKQDQKILLFRQYSEVEAYNDNEIWQKIAARGFLIKTFRGREDLLLHLSRAIAIQLHLLSMPLSSKGIVLSKVFDLGPQPFWLVYGRRSSKPRKKYGSLQTCKQYYTTYQQLHHQFPEIAVEPDVDRMIFKRNGVMLLSGPPTSDWSKEYFAHLRRLGIHLFSGSCCNHLGEICGQMGRHCKPGRDKDATGCAYVDDEELVYAFRDSRPAKHVAMLVRTPSPWANLPLHGKGEDVPSIIFAAGCHSQSGLLACSCITSEPFMRKLLEDIGWTPESNEPPWFAAIISQVSDQDPVVEYARWIQIRKEDEWYLELKYDARQQLAVQHEPRGDEGLVKPSGNFQLSNVKETEKEEETEDKGKVHKIAPQKVVTLKEKEIHILHLSDIHLGSNDKVELYLSQLTADLKQELKINKLDYTVISGDIADYSTSEEYEAAFNLISGLFNNFDLDSSRLVVVPGNHDLNWKLSKRGYLFKHKDELPEPLLEGSYIPAGDVGALVRDEVEYKKRFKNFNEYFYKKVYGRNYPPDYANQGILYPQPQDQILFLGLNSCWEIDHYFRKRASINSFALSRVLNEAMKPKYQDWLKIAVWHHSISGQDSMDDQFIERLIVAGFQVGVHGHIHEAKDRYSMYDIKRGIHIIGSGTFGAPAKEQVIGVPLQYNLLLFTQEKRTITVKTRKKEKPEGAWSADARWGDKNNPVPRYTIYLNRAGWIR